MGMVFDPVLLIKVMHLLLILREMVMMMRCLKMSVIVARNLRWGWKRCVVTGQCIQYLAGHI